MATQRGFRRFGWRKLKKYRYAEGQEDHREGLGWSWNGWAIWAAVLGRRAGGITAQHGISSTRDRVHNAVTFEMKQQRRPAMERKKKHPRFIQKKQKEE
jgi:hypothetical protein